MAKLTKRQKAIREKIETGKTYSADEAFALRRAFAAPPVCRGALRAPLR